MLDLFKTNKRKREEETEIEIEIEGSNKRVNNHNGSFFNVQSTYEWIKTTLSTHVFGYHPHNSLLDSIQKGDMLSLRAAIENGAHLDFADDHGNTLLHYGVMSGHIEVMKELLSLGIDINLANHDNLTAIDMACDQQKFTIAALIIQYQTDLYSIIDIETLFIHAIENKIWELIHLLVAEGFLINKKDINGQNYLHHAAIQGDLEKIKTLIEAGINLYAVDNNGLNSLHLAAQKGHLDIVKVLHKENVPINAKEINDNTPLHLAVRHQHVNLVSFLLQSNANYRLKNKKGQTPLHLAAGLGLENIIETCISSHCIQNWDIPNAKGETPLVVALYHNKIKKFQKNYHAHIATQLVLAGASIEPLLALSPMQVLKDAIQYQAITLLKTLLKTPLVKDFDINLKDHKGATLLHYATDVPTATILLDHGASIDALDFKQQSPLFYAAQNQYFELCHFLISRGADPYLVDRNQENIIHMAKSNNKNTDISRQLKKEIGFTEELRDKISLFIQRLLEKCLQKAEHQNKKLLILLGEYHGEYRGYLVEKIALKVADALGIQLFFVELPDKSVQTKDKTSYMPLAHAKKHLHFEIIGADNNRSNSDKYDCSKPGMRYRNKGLRKAIQEGNQHAVLITGANHLEGLLNEVETRIDHKKFFAVPINLSAIMDKHFKFNINLSFCDDLRNAIQFDFNGFNNENVESVLTKWNP